MTMTIILQWIECTCTLDCSFRLHEINNKIFTPFEINDSFDTPFADIDPDYQYYTNFHHNGKLSCDYYFEDKFRCKLDKNRWFTIIFIPT